MVASGSFACLVLLALNFILLGLVGEKAAAEPAES